LGSPDAGGGDCGRREGLPDLRRGGDRRLVELSSFMRKRGLPNVLDFPFRTRRRAARQAARARSRCCTGSRTTTTSGWRRRRRCRRSSATTTWGARRSRCASKPAD
jgi:hypothetical protein